MTSTPVVVESTPSEEKMRVSAPSDLTLRSGILGIVAAAGAWNVALVLFHNLMTRLLR
jgi:hypothetical protein